MKKDPRMKGFSWICPYLTVKDPGASLAFYENAFGFQRTNAITGADGKIMHAEMRYHDITVMLSPEGTPGCDTKSPATSKAECPMGLYVYHEDVDALCRHASRAGAEVVIEPNDAFWGDRMAQLKDQDGYIWTFATNVREFDPAKVPQS